MPTYTIVDKDTDPLGPNEIAAGDTISVSDGDTYIIATSANSNITFEAAGGGSADFEIIFAGSNTDSFDIKVEENLTPSITAPDNADLSEVKLDAKAADGVTFDIGDNVSFGQFDGSEDGRNDITIGNGFTTGKNWKLGDADDTFIVGDDATFENIDTEAGDDTVTFGDRATVHDMNTKEGNDDVRFGDDLDGHNIKTGDGDDTIYIGDNAQVSEVDGGKDSDTYRTETPGANAKNMESTNVVCFAPGTLVDTPDGPCAVELLKVGDLVITVDHGPQPIRWTRSSDHPLEAVDTIYTPVLIKAGALGQDRPSSDLIVSPQHRLLVGGHGQLDGPFQSEGFAPAKSLTGLRDIRHMKGKSAITWIHFACDRHEVITANGCLSESLLLGPMVLHGLPRSERNALMDIYGPSGSKGGALNGPAARECLKVGEVRRYLRKFKKNTGRRLAKAIREWDADLTMERYEADRLRQAAA